MAYSDTIYLVANDTLPFLSFSLKDSNMAAEGYSLDENDPTTWAPMDVTDATVRMRIRELGSSTIEATVTCLVVDGSNGVVTTNFPEGTLTRAGTFEAEIEVTYADENIHTVYDVLKLKVRDDFD